MGRALALPFLFMEKKDITKYELYANKALANYGLTYKEMLSRCDADGNLKVTIDKKEKKVKWWDHYKFSQEEYDKWKEYVVGDLKSKNPHMSEDSVIRLFNSIDMVYGLNLPLPLPAQLPQQEGECSREFRNLPNNSVY